jgi:hypothetical protein
MEDEKYLSEQGEKLAQILGLKRDREHKDRYVTSWGNKTALGLSRQIMTFAHLLENGEKIDI